MVIEWQRIRVRPDLRERYIELDDEVWTEGLSREPGFLGKEVWLGEDGREVVLVIRWRSEVDWQGIARRRLEEMERRFRREMPEGYEVVEVRSYEATRVRQTTGSQPGP